MVTFSESPYFLISGIDLSIWGEMWFSMRAVLKKVDEQGRVVLPAAWRRKHLRGNEVLVRARGDSLEILPQEKVDLTAYFDGADIDVDADLSDWRSVRRQLRKR